MDVFAYEQCIKAALDNPSDAVAVDKARDAAGHLRARCEAAEGAERRLVCSLAREEAAGLLHEFDGFQRAIRAVMAIIEARTKSNITPARLVEAREILEELGALYRRRN